MREREKRKRKELRKVNKLGRVETERVKVEGVEEREVDK